MTADAPWERPDGGSIRWPEDLTAAYERQRAALEVIVGPSDSGVWIDVYREAGGGYEGLQAIARAALEATEGGTR